MNARQWIRIVTGRGIYFWLMLSLSGVPALAQEFDTLAGVRDHYEVRERTEVTEPYGESLQQIQKDYLRAIDEGIAIAKKLHYEDALVELEEEKQRIESYQPLVANQYAQKSSGVFRLRTLLRRLMDYEKQKSFTRRQAIRDAYALTLRSLEDQLTIKGNSSAAGEVEDFRKQLQDQWRADADDEFSILPIAQSNGLNALPQFLGKAGRLKAIGEFSWGEPVLPPEVEQITDFVRVHAFEKCWVGIRKSGPAVIYAYVNNKRMNLRHENRFQQVSRSHDCWVAAQTNQFIREIEGRRFTLPHERPIGVVAVHTGGIAYWGDGRMVATGSGYTSKRLGPPPAEFFTGTAGTIAGALDILALTPEGGVQGWDTLNRRPVNFPEVGGVVEMEAGRHHALLRKAGGDVEVIALNDQGAADDSRWKIPPTVAGTALRVRAGELMSAVQREDASWFAWGPNRGLAKAVGEIGPAMDLDLFGNGNSGYAIWIEPVDEQPVADGDAHADDEDKDEK